MRAAHARYGRLPWSKVLEPAVRYAKSGIEVHPQLYEEIVDKLPRFAGKTNFADYFAGARRGAVFTQPELAATLQTLAENPDDFYQGEIARKIVAQMARDGGLISLADLKSYRAVWREPLLFTWRDYQLVSAPPPSSGGIALAQLLGIHERTSSLFAGVAHNSAEYLHLLAEIEKRVFADRGKIGRAHV